MQDREAQLDAVAELIERDLLLLGATAIEDKLQQVPGSLRASTTCSVRGSPDCRGSIPSPGVTCDGWATLSPRLGML